MYIFFAAGGVRDGMVVGGGGGGGGGYTLITERNEKKLNTSTFAHGILGPRVQGNADNRKHIIYEVYRH